MSEQKQETPRPWKRYDAPLRKEFPTIIHEIQSGSTTVIHWAGFDGLDISEDELNANLDLIIRAVNAHDELVAAAKAALGYLEQMYGSYDSLVRQLKAAITAAEQPEGK